MDFDVVSYFPALREPIKKLDRLQRLKFSDAVFEKSLKDELVPFIICNDDDSGRRAGEHLIADYT